jgi:sarcosine/dimethylglycine N-methyltransferase
MKRYDEDAVDRLFARIWGESIHFGQHGAGPSPIDEATRETKRLLAEAAGVAPGARILEVGSGWGATARYLAARGAEVVATNYSARQARAAARRCAAERAAGRVRLAMADFHALPFADGSMHLHWSQECLVHAADKARVFAEAFRVLRPGGRLVFSDQTTRAERLDAAGRERIARRHGNADLWPAEAFAEAVRAAGFEAPDVRDWSDHMERHFALLTKRIAPLQADPPADISAPVIEENAAMWAWGAELAAAGAIGWHAFIAVKPG